VQSESTVGHFKLRRLMLAGQLQAFKVGGSAISPPPLIKRGSTKTRLAPGSFRRRLTVAQKSSAPLDVLLSGIGEPEPGPSPAPGDNAKMRRSTEGVLQSPLLGIMSDPN